MDWSIADEEESACDGAGRALLRRSAGEERGYAMGWLFAGIVFWNINIKTLISPRYRLITLIAT